jgi:Flp pilus assembly protein TadB
MAWLPPGLGSFTRLLIGVLLVQAVTALIVAVAMNGDWRANWPLFGALGAAVGLMATFWFNAIVGDHRRLTAAALAERFARERETLREKAEKRAARQIREREKQSEARARQQAQEARRSSWRSGLGFGGAAALGVMLLMGQMLAVGALVLGATGVGAIAYHRWRAKRTDVEALPAAERAKPLIEA